MQPPSGGCVLKHPQDKLQAHLDKAATFGWLCVETRKNFHISTRKSAATFGWLCVETFVLGEYKPCLRAATFGWLCVETVNNGAGFVFSLCSHLRVAVCWNQTKTDTKIRVEAATFGWLCVETKTSKIIHAVEPAATFGWLCVETLMNLINYSAWLSSRLQAAVCWNYNLYHQKVAYVCSHLRVAVCWNHHQQRDCI